MTGRARRRDADGCESVRVKVMGFLSLRRFVFFNYTNGKGCYARPMIKRAEVILDQTGLLVVKSVEEMELEH